MTTIDPRIGLFVTVRRQHLPDCEGMIVAIEPSERGEIITVMIGDDELIDVIVQETWH